MGTATTTNAFLTWFSEWGQVLYVGVQVVFWTAIAAAALIVALQYKKLVTFKVGGSTPAEKAEQTAEVEAFVE